MSWSSGVTVANEIWELMRPLTNVNNRQYYARQLIEAIEEADCDNTDECGQLTEDANANYQSTYCEVCGCDSCGCDDPNGSDDLHTRASEGPNDNETFV